LVFEEAPFPRLAEGELLVRVHAAAVTPTELEWAPTWTTRAGGPRSFPIILGHQFSGVLRAVAPGVTDLVEGAAIFGMNDSFRDGAQENTAWRVLWTSLSEYATSPVVSGFCGASGPVVRSVHRWIACSESGAALTHRREAGNFLGPLAI
jgi:NADPH:quinone reductase-like Zn-dependent oxidoreductase